MIYNLNIKSKGFALVLVLWVLSLLTLMAGSFALGMRREISITEGIKNNAQAAAIAESGIAIAELMLLGSETDKINAEQDKSWRTDGSIYQINYGDTRVRIRMLSETGKIDINQADTQLLRALFSRAPATEDDRNDPLIRVSKWVGAVMDWRDSDDTVSPNGAEKPEYQTAGLKYQPANKAFQNIEELQMVLGMNAKTFKWLEPLITVYSGQAQVDKSATREVLSLLPDLEPGIIGQFLEARSESAKLDKPLTFPITSKYINGAEAEGLQSGAVTIISEAKLADGSRAAVGALVIKSEVDPALPFQVLKWQRSYANEISLFSTAMNELLVAQYNEPQFND
ncbi:general secretion pathway protein GspK [Crenothrix sp.]|uniref:general secretion pathway protein GspK n=1 Tax=Crenothrix sp. TaxID=3100433 RepID=UPI00374DA3FA